MYIIMMILEHFFLIETRIISRVHDGARLVSPSLHVIQDMYKLSPNLSLAEMLLMMRVVVILPNRI